MKIIKKIFCYLRNPTKVINYFGSKGRLKFIPDKMYLKLVYRANLDKKLNLDQPITFTEKIQWLKLYDRNPEYIKLVDKYLVREHIEKLIGSKYLVPLIGIYNNIDEIELSKLPNQFVLKCTHDSGSVVICKDKSNFDWIATKKKLTRCLKRNYYYTGREWPYKFVKPRIVCERFMTEGLNEVPKDYKVYCFHGEPKLIFILRDKYKKGVRKSGTVYTTQWEALPCVLDNHYELNMVEEQKPECLEELLSICRKLCEGFCQVRIDFYIINETIYFSEITLSTSSGLVPIIPNSYDVILGSYLQLPMKSMER